MKWIIKQLKAQSDISILYEHNGRFSPGLTVKMEKEQSATVEVPHTRGHGEALYKETTRSTELFNSNRASDLVWGNI